MKRKTLLYGGVALTGIAVAAVVVYFTLFHGRDGNTSPVKPEEANQAVLLQLRKACSAPAFRGAVIKSVTSENDKLVLHGTIDSEQQRADLVKRATEILDEDPPLRQVFPHNPPDGQHLKVYPVRSRYLPEMQQLLVGANAIAPSRAEFDSMTSSAVTRAN